MTDRGEPAITPKQLSEALRLLGWSTTRFAARLEISEPSVSQFLRDGIYKRAFKPADARSYLEAAGVEFIAGDRSRVRMRLGNVRPGTGVGDDLHVSHSN